MRNKFKLPHMKGSFYRGVKLGATVVLSSALLITGVNLSVPVFGALADGAPANGTTAEATVDLTTADPIADTAPAEGTTAADAPADGAADTVAATDETSVPETPDTPVEPSNYEASVTVNGETTNYEEFTAAWTAAKDANKAEITLLQYIGISEGITVDSGEDITINSSNSYGISLITMEPVMVRTVGYLIQVAEGGKLTINGGEYSASDNMALVLGKDSQVQISGGIFGGAYAISVADDMKLCDILANYGDNSTDVHYAIQDMSNEYYSGEQLNAKTTVQGKTVTIVKCDHKGKTLAHGEKCQYCHYTPQHTYDENGVCTDCQAQAVAEVTANRETKYYPTIEEALQAAYAVDPVDETVFEENSLIFKVTVNFLQDIKIDKPLVISYGYSHLGGDEFRKDIALKSDNDSTITSSGSCVIDAQDCWLTIESGEYVSTGTAADLTASDKGALSITSDNAYVLIKGGVFEGKEYGLYNNDYNCVYLDGGTFTGGTNAIYSNERWTLMDMLKYQELDGDKYFAYYNDNGVITNLGDKKELPAGTVKVQECNHEKTELAKDHETNGTCRTCLGCGQTLTYHVCGEDNICTVCKAVAVAEYDGKKYSTLENAWEAWNDTKNEDSGVITLLNDLTLKMGLECYGASLALDGDGHTITVDADYCAFGVSSFGDEPGNLTIKDCEIKASEEANLDLEYLIKNSDTLNLINCDLIANEKIPVAVKSYDDTKLSIDGGSISANANGIELGNNCAITLTGGCEIKGKGDSVGGSDTVGIILGENAEAEFVDFKVTDFKTEIKAATKNVNEYLVEDSFFWNADGAIIREGLDVKEYDGNVDVHPCVHETTTIDGAKDATCTEVGYTGDTVCDKCRKVFTEGTDIEKLPHSYRDEVTTEPTYDNEGVRTFTCEKCGDSYTEDIPKLDKPAPSTPSTPSTPSRPSTPSYTPSRPSYRPSRPSHRTDPEPSDTTDNPGEAPSDTKPEDTAKPNIKGENGKEGWDAIRAEAETITDGGRITVDMNGVTEVPSDVLNSIKGKDITIVFDMGDGVSWSVTGTDITGEVGNIDFGVSVGTSGIPAEVINNVTGENYSVQLSLSYTGEFGLTAVLSVDLGAESAGCYASLFYYNTATGELEFISESQITEGGMANLKFTHASDYVIVVNEKSMFDEAGTAETSETSEASGTSEASDTSESSDTSEASDTSESSDTSEASETESTLEDTLDSGETEPTSDNSDNSGDSSDSSDSSESDTSDSTKDNPDTGMDRAYVVIWLAVALCCAMSVFIIVRRKKDGQR